MNNKLATFCLKALLLMVPLILVLGSYIYFDPFKVVRAYDSYYESGKISYVSLNGGYVAMETFLRRYPHIKYDSFIFGSSRSILYPVGEWKKYIKAKECFHLSSSGESLYGIYKKFKFFEKNKIPVKNALFILDASLLDQVVDSEIWDRRQHPVLTSEPRISFQLRFFKTFANPKFLISFFDLKIRGKYRPYMVTTLSDNIFLYDADINEFNPEKWEQLIMSKKEDYYYSRQDLFSKKDDVQKYPHAVIGPKQKEMLHYIRQQLDINSTTYRVVISPLFDQVKLNAGDFESLCGIFGRDHVFDFSGANEITASAYNYYDWSHYRPHVCKWILSRIYAN